MACRMTKLSSFSWIKQPDTNGGLTYPLDTVRSFSASGGGTPVTIVSTGLGASSDSNDDFCGWIVECTDATNTQNIGLRRRITDVNDATNTFTTDAFPGATSSGDQFLLMKPPIALCVANSSASSTNNVIPSRDRNESNGYWSGVAQVGGPYVIVVAAANASTTNHIRISTNTSADINLASSLSGSVAIGDYFEIWKHPEIINSGMLELTQDMIERNPTSGNFGKFASVNGNRTGSGTVELAFRGPGNGRAGSYAEAHEVLSTVLDSTASGGDSTVSGSSTTTTINYSVGNHSVGDLGLTDTGYACMVTADSGSAYTVSPLLGAAPSSSDTFYGMTTYSPSDCINSALSICQYRAKDILEYAYGCVPALSFNAARGEFLKISCAFQVADWIRVGAHGTELSRGWRPKLSTVDPIKMASGRAILDGVAYKLKSFSFDLGLDIQPRTNITAPNDIDGFELVGDSPTGTIEVYNGTNERKALDHFLAGKNIEMIAHFGTTPGYPGVMVFWAYRIRYTGATIGDDAGQVTLSLPFEVIYDPTSSLERYSIGIC